MAPEQHFGEVVQQRGLMNDFGVEIHPVDRETERDTDRDGDHRDDHAARMGAPLAEDHPARRSAADARRFSGRGH